MLTRRPFAIVLLSLLFFLPGMSILPVIDRDEAHFAQASRQMLQSGEYFQIRFQEATRFQKPPGINWLQALSVKSLSQADAKQIWPYRLPSLFGAIAAVLLTAGLARRFVSSVSASLAAALLASSLLMVVEAHMAVIDACLLASVVLMQGALWVIYDHSLRAQVLPKFAALTFWLAMSLGFVLKGVSPLFGGLSLLTLCLISEAPLRRRLLTNLSILPGLGLFLGFNLIWLYFVNQAEHSNYLLQMLNRDLLPKLKGGHESHGQPPLFHLGLLPLSFWPASLFLVPTGLYAFKHRRLPNVSFLIAWILPSWIFFEFMPTKLPQYVLPLFPALSILTAMAIEEHVHHKPGRGLRLLQLAWGLLSLSIALGFLILSWLILKTLTLSGILISLFIVVFSSLSVCYCYQGYYKRSLNYLLAMTCLSYPLIFHSFLPSLSPLWISQEVSLQLKDKQLSEKSPLLVIGFEEPSLVFYLNTNNIRFVNTLDDVGQSDLVLIEENALTPLLAKQLHLKTKIRGFNYSKGQWLTLYLMQKRSKRSLDVA